MKTDTAPTRVKLAAEEFAGIVEKIKRSREDLVVLRDRRRPVLDAYYRKALGNELEGRSWYQSAIVFNQIEGTFPMLMGQARASDNQVRVKGPDPQVAKGLLVKVREAIAENNDFLLFSSLIKDGLISITGSAKLWWEESYRKIVEEAAGVPEEKVAALTALYEAGQIHGLDVTEDEPQMVIGVDPDTGMELVGFAPQTYTVRVTLYELEKSEAKVVPIPPEQFLVERGKAHINDSRGCGHQTTMTVGELLTMQDRLSTPDEPFFDPEALRTAIARATRDEDSGQQQERRAREEMTFSSSGDGRLDFNLTSSELRRPVTFVEWSDNVVHDNKVQPFLIWIASDVELRSQPNEDAFIPMVAWSPFLVPHSIVGMGVGEQHVANQDAQTQLGRALLDHVARTVDEEVYIINPGTDILGLKNRRAGGMVYGEPGKDFVRGSTNNLDAKLIQAAEFIKGDSHDTGPANRWTMGSNVDPQNTTATGQQIMAAASSVRQNMILLVFVECLVDLYNKLIKLFQRHSKGFTVEVEGETLTFTAEQIQGSYIAYSQVERQFDPNSAQMMRANLLKQEIQTLAQTMPGMVTPQNLYAAERRWLMELGETNVTEYITPPPMPAMPTPGPDQALGSEAPVQMGGGGF